jgi:hypothetical protein
VYPIKNLTAPTVSIFVYLTLATIAWIYIWLRAIFIPFQSDEAATFFMYIQTGQFFPPRSVIDANNHILNSILTWFSYKIFGSSPLSLRLPNIFAALVYFYFIFKLSELLKWNVAKWGFILLSAGTHFILEFFSYSRGYGISIALISGAIYQLIILLKVIRLKRVILAVLFTLLASAANLNLILISLSVYLFLAMILFRAVSVRKKTLLSALLIIILAGGASSVYFIYNSFQIREVAGFYYGSSAGFFKVTVDSLASMITGRFKIITEVLAVSTFIISTLIMIIWLASKKQRQRIFTGYNIFFALLLISWAGSLILNHIWQVNFQEDRAAMHLIPLFYGMVFFGLDSFSLQFRRYALIAILPFVFIMVYSIQQISLDKTAYGNSQQAPVKFYQYIRNDGSGKPFPPVVSSYQARRQSWAFLNYRSGGLLNPLTGSAFPNSRADFLIFEFPFPDSLKSIFEPVLTDQNTQTALYRNISLNGSISSSNLLLENAVSGQKEYYDLFKISTGGMIGKSLRLEIELTVESAAKPLQATVVVEVFDGNREPLAYEAIDLDQLQPVWDKQHHLFRHVLLVGHIPPESETALVYFWNKKKAPVNILAGQLNIYISEGSKEK